MFSLNLIRAFVVSKLASLSSEIHIVKHLLRVSKLFNHNVGQHVRVYAKPGVDCNITLRLSCYADCQNTIAKEICKENRRIKRFFA